MNNFKKLIIVGLMMLHLMTLLAMNIDKELSSLKGYPRLFPWDKVEENIKTNYGNIYKNALKKDADAILKEEIIKYEKPGAKTGGRLLYTARKVLSRVETLVGAYYVFKDEKYSQRAIEEMVSAANYPSWNPSHFLDVGELTFALALGYDALYNQISDEDKKTIENAIIKKGLEVSFVDSKSWMKHQSNWTQVCQTGLIAGAIVIADKNQALAKKTIIRGVEELKIVMNKIYAPVGCYPEGPGYWMYGTNYNCYLIAVLDNAFGTSFDLDKTAGFGESALFMNAAVMNNSNYFRYSDCFGSYQVSFAKFFLAEHFDRNEYLSEIDRKIFKGVGKGRARPVSMTMLYFPKSDDVKDAPLYYNGDNESKNPIVVYRTGYAFSDKYLGIRAGDVNTGHGHQDQGSFTFSKDGIIWSDDIGPEGYEKLQAAKVDFWHSERWTVFRLGARSHSTLMLNDQDFNMDGRGNILYSDEEKTILDLTSLYPDLQGTHSRTFFWNKDGSFKIIDEFTGLKKDTDVRWQMFTRADISINDKVATLSQKGKKLIMTLDSYTPVEWSYIDANSILQSFDSKNTNGKLLYVKTKAPETGKLKIVVEFQ